MFVSPHWAVCLGQLGEPFFQAAVDYLGTLSYLTKAPWHPCLPEGLDRLQWLAYWQAARAPWVPTYTTGIPSGCEQSDWLMFLFLFLLSNRSVEGALHRADGTSLKLAYWFPRPPRIPPAPLDDDACGGGLK